MSNIQKLKLRVQQHNLDRMEIDRMLWQAMLACSNQTIDGDGIDCSLTVNSAVDKAAQLVLAHLDNSMAG